ncbi:MAG: hypothetical protein AB7G10_26025 [Reyranellaceae bacterium]
MSAKHQPTDELRRTVEAMAGYGIPHRDIGIVVGVSEPTLRKCYRTELTRGHVVANTKVAQNLFTIANGKGREAVTAAIFWLKTRAGWSEHAAYKPPGFIPAGKKAAAAAASDLAGQGTEWADDLNPPVAGTPLN